MSDLTKYKICPECGAHNSPSLVECKFCGTDMTAIKQIFDSDSPEPPHPQADPGAADEPAVLVRICDACGKENPANARICSSCGEEIGDVIPCPSKNPAESTVKYELISVDGSFSVTVDNPVFIIGREHGLQTWMENRLYVGRIQARLTVHGGGVYIEDLSKTNKTFVNNAELSEGTPTELADGDEIGLGGKVIDGARQNEAVYLIFRKKQ